jgi:single-stranded-DNA-specific exonuclease
VGTLARALKVHPLAARVLVNRGYADADSAERFLRPTFEHLHDPFLLRGMKEAVGRLARAVTGGEKILLYGDYDVDGTCSIVILKKAIELAGGRADFHVPHRLRDGYGMRADVIERAAAEGVSLVVTVDTGIRANEAIARARESGIDVIVTDHHLPEHDLPPAVAILNPNQPGCPYPDKNLCGAGVTFKLILALMRELGWPEAKLRRMAESLLKLVALATVADVAPLTGENRVIVKYGLEGLREVRNAGLRALMQVAGFNEGEIPTAGQVAFRIAPRINAAGRMANARDVIELFLTDDEARARALAGQLQALNQDRQQAESEIVRQITDECARTPVTDGQMALVFCGKGWHRGVVGIVASRLVEQFHRPVFVLSDDGDGEAQGSGRSLHPFHLLEALQSMEGLFTRFGGHRQAAGLGLPVARVGEFRRRINEYAAARLRPEDFRPVIEVDAQVELAEVNDASVADVLSLAPFGFGNPAPVFAAHGLEVAEAPVVLKDRHLRLKLRQNGRMLVVKAWNFAERRHELRFGSNVDAVISFEADSYALSRGYAGWSATLKDVRPA